MTVQHTAGGRTYEFGVGDRLRAARESTGLNQQQFADEIGISKGTVNNYENGHSTPRKIVLKAWALRTDFNLGWLETGKPPSDPDGGDGVRREGIEPPTR